MILNHLKFLCVDAKKLNFSWQKLGEGSQKKKKAENNYCKGYGSAFSLNIHNVGGLEQTDEKNEGSC